MATRLGKAALAGGAAALLVYATPAQARITRIIVDRVTQGPSGALTANYQSFAGRAFGELDPNDPHNAIITDVNFGKDADGKVRYVTSFFIVAPKDPSQTSGFL